LDVVLAFLTVMFAQIQETALLALQSTSTTIQLQQRNAQPALILVLPALEPEIRIALLVSPMPLCQLEQLLLKHVLATLEPPTTQPL
jgi:hypothetical protein